MTELAVAIEKFGEVLRERLRSLREKGEAGTDYFRRLLLVYAELGAIVNIMIGLGEIDPETGERIRKGMAPELRGLREAGLR